MSYYKVNQLSNHLSVATNTEKQISLLAIKFNSRVHRSIIRLSTQETSLRQKIKDVFTFVFTMDCDLLCLTRLMC